MLAANPSLTANAAKAILMMTGEPMFADTVPASCYDNVDWRGDSACVAAPEIEEGGGLLNPPGAVYLATSVSASTASLTVGSQWSIRSVTPITYYSSTADGEIWSQGVIWTGIVVFNHNAWDIFQAAYPSGQIWGQGVIWTGMQTGHDPVWSSEILQLWIYSFVSPDSLGDGSAVLGGYNDGWESPPGFLNSNEDGFPEA
jgi:hypothetical protein